MFRIRSRNSRSLNVCLDEGQITSRISYTSPKNPSESFRNFRIWEFWESLQNLGEPWKSFENFSNLRTLSWHIIPHLAGSFWILILCLLCIFFYCHWCFGSFNCYPQSDWAFHASLTRILFLLPAWTCPEMQQFHYGHIIAEVDVSVGTVIRHTYQGHNWFTGPWFRVSFRGQSLF